jgi:hypothetical protein
MLQKRQKVLARAPSTRDPKRKWRAIFSLLPAKPLASISFEACAAGR